MSEITEKNAANLSADDAETLLHWRNWITESFVYGLSMQGLLDLYHASSEYATLESWLCHEIGARDLWAAIKKEHTV